MSARQIGWRCGASWLQRAQAQPGYLPPSQVAAGCDAARGPVHGHLKSKGLQNEQTRCAGRPRILCALRQLTQAPRWRVRRMIEMQTWKMVVPDALVRPS